MPMATKLTASAPSTQYCRATAGCTIRTTNGSVNILSQPHRGSRAASDSETPFFRRQRAHRHRDDECVIARQQQVDQYDRQAVQEEMHGTRPIQLLTRRK